MRSIKRESEQAESLRRALEEERAAVAEKFAKLDREFQKRERERQVKFEKQLGVAVAEFEKLSRELVAKVQERVDRVKVEREVQKRAAELKREAQRAAQATASNAAKQPVEEAAPPVLRGVRVIRDGKVIGDGGRVETEVEQSVPAVSRDHKHGEIKVGDQVRLLSFGSIGTVDRIKGNEAEVRVGSLRTREHVSNLELIAAASDKRNEVSTSRGSGRVNPSLEELRKQAATTELHLHSKEPDSRCKTHNELNLIGKTTDEAVELADKFLDEAFLNGLNEVRIIHGHGTGALRKAISEFLNDHPHVERFASAPQDQGGAGATQVELKS